MVLSELIAHLDDCLPSTPVPMGFHRPHSYRGNYTDLAFEPCENTTVGAMLACANAALGTAYEGYKGGTHRMTEGTDVHLAKYGETGEGLGEVLLGYMVGKYAGVAGNAESARTSPAGSLQIRTSDNAIAWSTGIVSGYSINMNPQRVIDRERPFHDYREFLRLADVAQKIEDSEASWDMKYELIITTISTLLDALNITFSPEIPADMNDDAWHITWFMDEVRTKARDIRAAFKWVVL